MDSKFNKISKILGGDTGLSEKLAKEAIKSQLESTGQNVTDDLVNTIYNSDSPMLRQIKSAIANMNSTIEATKSQFQSLQASITTSTTACSTMVAGTLPVAAPGLNIQMLTNLQTSINQITTTLGNSLLQASSVGINVPDSAITLLETISKFKVPLL